MVVVGFVVGTALGAVLAGSVLGVEGFAAGPPALLDPSVPRVPEDLGVGERVFLVVAGIHPSREAAEAAAGRFDFGDVQGFYAVPADQFDGLPGRHAARPGAWALVSAFRTRAGAEEFAAMAARAGATPAIEGPFLSLGGAYAGLGQEKRPDGRGPLTGPLDRPETGP